MDVVDGRRAGAQPISCGLAVGARRARTALLVAADRLSPAALLPVPRTDGVGSVGFVCIYRRRNASTLRALLADLPAGTAARLWALDEPVPELASLTIGSGPGGRLELLNRIVATLPPGADHLVLADDDVELVNGDIERLLRVGAAAGFDLYQPAHAPRSANAFAFARRRPLLLARESRFVEQGPVVVMSRHAQDVLLPLPGELGMGWGVEVRWSRLAQQHGLRLGIVDAVGLRHHQGGAHPYDTGKELAQLEREVAAAGLTDLRELQVTVRRVGAVRLWRDRVLPRRVLSPGSAPLHDSPGPAAPPR